MAGRPTTVRLSRTSEDLLLREASRRGITPDALADELLQAALTTRRGDLAGVLSGLARFRASLPQIDGLATSRAARGDLEHRRADPSL